MQCPWRPEKGLRYPGTGVTEILNLFTRTKANPESFCKIFMSQKMGAKELALWVKVSASKPDKAEFNP